MYGYDEWLENERIWKTEKESPVLAHCQKCREELYDGDNAYLDDINMIYLCQKCVNHIEDDDEEEYEIIQDNFTKITLNSYDFDLDWGDE